MKKILLLTALLLFAAPATAPAATVKLHTEAEWKRTRGAQGVVVVVHGGGMHRGSRFDTGRLGIDRYILSRGYDVLSIDYELSCDVGARPLARGTGPCIGPGSAPTAINTVRRWTRWARARYRNVVLFGGSAGGYLALAAAHPRYVSSVVALSPMLNPSFDRAEQRGVWPYAWERAFGCVGVECDQYAITRSHIPTVILHARHDRSTSYRAVRAHGARVVTYAGTCHGWSCLRWPSRMRRLPF